MAYTRRVEDIPGEDGPNQVMHRRLWYLAGPLGTVQYMTFWYPPGSAITRILTRDRPRLGDSAPYVYHPDGSLTLPADLGLHSTFPQYDGHELWDENCQVTGGRCYYDGSTMVAGQVAALVADNGFDEEIIWGWLQGYYESVFEDREALAGPGKEPL